MSDVYTDDYEEDDLVGDIVSSMIHVLSVFQGYLAIGMISQETYDTVETLLKRYLKMIEDA